MLARAPPRGSPTLGRARAPCTQRDAGVGCLIRLIWRPHAHAAAAAAAAAAPGPPDAFVLDFDGVLCHSEPEVSSSALEACERRWPALFGGLPPAERARVLAGLATARPRLVRGFEAMVQARLVLEDPRAAAAILAGPWEGPGGLLEAALARFGEDAGALAAEFEAGRRARLENEPHKWLSLHALYPGVRDALAACEAPVYFASSKHGGRLAALLHALLGLEGMEGSPRVFAGLIPPTPRKIEALRAVAAGAAPGARLAFVDDRFDTLAGMARDARVAARYTLCLAEWGYCTPEERAAAAAAPGIEVLSLSGFCAMLRGARRRGGEAAAAVGRGTIV